MTIVNIIDAKKNRHEKVATNFLENKLSSQNKSKIINLVDTYVKNNINLKKFVGATVNTDWHGIAFQIIYEYYIQTGLNHKASINAAGKMLGYIVAYIIEKDANNLGITKGPNHKGKSVNYYHKII